METANPPVNLYKALHKARAAMGIVAKGGHNKFDNYDYAKLDDFIAVLQKPLDDNGLIVISDIDTIEWCDDRTTQKGGTEKVCRVRLRTDVIHVESGESKSVTVLGEGQDRGDKAAYKAYTGARKYALANLFNLATGDDPETESHDSAENPFRKNQPPATRKPPATQQPKAQLPAAPRLTDDTDLAAWERHDAAAYIAHAKTSQQLLDLLNRLATTPEWASNMEDWPWVCKLITEAYRLIVGANPKQKNDEFVFQMKAHAEAIKAEAADPFTHPKEGITYEPVPEGVESADV